MKWQKEKKVQKVRLGGGIFINKICRFLNVQVFSNFATTTRFINHCYFKRCFKLGLSKHYHNYKFALITYFLAIFLATLDSSCWATLGIDLLSCMNDTGLQIELRTNISAACKFLSISRSWFCSALISGVSPLKFKIEKHHKS